jgi:hypothetical protein
MRSWDPKPEMPVSLRGVGDLAEKQGQWIEQYPVIKRVGNTFLLRFTSDEQLVDLLSALEAHCDLRQSGGISHTITAPAVLQFPEFKGQRLAHFQTESWYVEGRILVCLN